MSRSEIMKNLRLHLALFTGTSLARMTLDRRDKFGMLNLWYKCILNSWELEIKIIQKIDKLWLKLNHFNSPCFCYRTAGNQ